MAGLAPLNAEDTYIFKESAQSSVTLVDIFRVNPDGGNHILVQNEFSMFRIETFDYNDETLQNKVDLAFNVPHKYLATKHEAGEETYLFKKCQAHQV